MVKYTWPYQITKNIQKQLLSWYTNITSMKYYSSSWMASVTLEYSLTLTSLGPKNAHIFGIFGILIYLDGLVSTSVWRFSVWSGWIKNSRYRTQMTQSRTALTGPQPGKPNRRGGGRALAGAGVMVDFSGKSGQNATKTWNNQPRNQVSKELQNCFRVN